ncbi:MAG: extracellular solute-binding protein [Clostridia bacterium]|nr:extracellular solute-binding protein [Clostridia bacterium]NCC42046.1 extracellular solute-binding protein [Clostridia bacterium]
MKKYVLGFLCAAALLCSGCHASANVRPEAEKEEAYPEEITLMHVDGSKPEFLQFIQEAEKTLQIKIHVIESPQNADNRHAKISTILSSGDDSVDVIGINDEMMSEFKGKGYLEPLGEDVMPGVILDCYPEEYMKKISMLDGKVYSVPYMMDIMLYWVNEEMLEAAGIDTVDTKEDFDKLLETHYENGIYGYGSAWEESYVYNEIFQFVNMFGGDYYDWSNEDTRTALRYLHDMLKDGYVPENQFLDQYDQMEQKFLGGEYGSIFMYSGVTNILTKSSAYGEGKIHAAFLPEFRKKVTNVATWQYVLNKSSHHKEAAKKFLAYAATQEGNLAYCEKMNALPARLDMIEKGMVNSPNVEIIREYIQEVKLEPRPFSEQPMEDIRKMGNIFREYVSDEISLDTFCKKAQKIVE